MVRQKNNNNNIKEQRHRIRVHSFVAICDIDLLNFLVASSSPFLLIAFLRGDHIEIVALRELFNTEVEIYNYDCVTKDDGRPIRMSTGATLSHLTNDDRHSIPIVRLSYHGSNHYNSIVDPTHPPPIGDGRQAKINLRQLRQEHEAKESKEAQQRKQRETDNKSTPTANASSSNEDQPKPVRIVRSSSNQNIPSPTLRRPSNVHTPLSSTTAAPSPTRVKV